jgi:hypothetical protein
MFWNKRQPAHGEAVAYSSIDEDSYESFKRQLERTTHRAECRRRWPARSTTSKPRSCCASKANLTKSYLPRRAYGVALTGNATTMVNEANGQKVQKLNFPSGEA